MNQLVGVSVIIPVYNVKPYLDRCIVSVVSQTYKNIEIILINDGSFDDSDEICMRWSKLDARIMYISKKNEGLGITRNLGIRASSYDYITFLDSDDWLEPEFIEKLLGKMIKEDAEMSLCDINYVDSITMQKSTSVIRIDSQIVSAQQDTTVVNKVRTFAWGKIYKKRLFINHDVRFPANTFEDIPCVPLLAAVASSIVYVPEALCNYYRNRSESLSNNPSNISDIALSLRLLCERFKKAGLDEVFHTELKKIVLGQVRFAFQKWGSLGNQNVLIQLSILASMAGEYIYELKDLTEKKYFVIGDKLLFDAIDKVVLSSKQITTDVDKANYIIAYEDMQIDKMNNVRKIIMIKPVINKGEEETLVWDMAETIMEEL